MNHRPLTKEQWLGLTNEPPIEPSRPICDPHHHLWDRPKNRYLAEDFLDDLEAGHNIVSTVFIECGAGYLDRGPKAMRPVGETHFALREATSAATVGATTNVAAGIVSFVDLTLGDAVVPVVEAHRQAAKGRFRGIRHCVATDADDHVPPHRIEPPAGLLADARFRDGFSTLHHHGASFEAWLYHPQLPELINLASDFPETTIILNHVGGPLGVGGYANDRATTLSTWYDSIKALSKYPNVAVKLGGLGMPICGFGWESRAKPPSSELFASLAGTFIHHCIDCFGTQRAMFESNFPVDKVTCSYSILWNAFKRIASRYRASEQDALFYDSAARLYRLCDRT